MDISVSAGPSYRKPLEADWPDEELEHLGKCPVCAAVQRSVAYEGLQDKVFFCAPGKWTSWRCDACDVVYLDPRPTASSIEKAYAVYYTHEPDRAARPKRSALQRLRRIVPNSYLNKKFGYRLRPALPFAALVLEWQPARAFWTSQFYRHLPGPRHPDDCLLDVGCGNGQFLEIARDQLKYNVEGLEIDPRSREVARKRGLIVHEGSMPGAGLKPASYFQVTLSHVLEHLHDPVAALNEIFALLKPGGRVWITVPNIAAASLDRFGSHSRLLEPPRHLVMFDTKSLRAILIATGFQNVSLIPQTGAGDFAIFEQSWMMENGIDPYSSDAKSIPEYQELIARGVDMGGASKSERSEFITMTGAKPE